ncbi:MAG: hypothetical protein GC181_12550 [Bacteroidetes bacterium]|nr:hypothetical protein [Bacteroidota bacterium]
MKESITFDFMLKAYLLVLLASWLIVYFFIQDNSIEIVFVLLANLAACGYLVRSVIDLSKGRFRQAINGILIFTSLNLIWWVTYDFGVVKSINGLLMVMMLTMILMLGVFRWVLR